MRLVIKNKVLLLPQNRRTNHKHLPQLVPWKLPYRRATGDPSLAVCRPLPPQVPPSFCPPLLQSLPFQLHPFGSTLDQL